jgi:hypothetical protein
MRQAAGMNAAANSRINWLLPAADRRLALAGLIAIASCRVEPTPAPVPVKGTHEELSTIAGEWNGQYLSKETGRRGVVRFIMAEHADTGYGEVEITFSPALSLTREAEAPDLIKSDLGDDESAPKPCTILNIRVVRVDHDRVRGTMEPYWDPDCDCRARTEFEGKVSGNRITGTFTSRRESSDRRLIAGQWRVDRER